MAPRRVRVFAVSAGGSDKRLRCGGFSSTGSPDTTAREWRGCAHDGSRNTLADPADRTAVLVLLPSVGVNGLLSSHAGVRGCVV